MATLTQIIQALGCATDQNPAVLKQAEEWLRGKESDESFYVSLSEICRTREVEWTVRWMAVIYLKNGIDRYWRSGISGSLSPKNKAAIRVNLSQCLEEPVHQIASQSAVVIAKIARFDYPTEWKELIPILFSGLSSPKNPLHQNRSLLTLKHVIKMLSRKKLPYAKEQFSELCRKSFNDIFMFWVSHLQAFRNTVEQCRHSCTNDTTENHVLLSQIIYYMMQDYGREVTEKIFGHVLGSLREIITLAQCCIENEKVYRACKKSLISVVKILDSLLLSSPQSYVLGAQKVMSVLSEQIHQNISTKIDHELKEKYIVKCMNVVKAILDSSHFNDTFLGGSADLSGIAPGLENLFQSLVCHYLPLKEEDLESWQDDPESFSNEEVGESWKYNLRPSAEILSLTLLKKFPALLVPSLLNMLNVVKDLTVHNVTSSLVEANSVLQVIFQGCTTPLECMVRKEAVYYMIGLGVYEVLESINFEEWLVNKLIPEVKSIQNDGHGKLIHRRVLWLISQWTEIKPSDELKPILYGFVVASLGKSFDMAVRLAAASTVQYLLDDFEFDIMQFQEHQDSCFQGLFDLLMDTQSCDTKMRILNVFSYMIERLGACVLPYEEKISSIIPTLWDHAVSESHDMLKCTIMGTMVQFILALKDKSESISFLTFPLVKESTDLNNPSHVYLLEDGLDLWLATVQNYNSPSEGLLGLFSNIFGLLEYGSEILKTCFSIIEAYIVLYQWPLLSQYGAMLDRSFLNLSSDVRNECLTLTSRLVAMVVEISPEGEDLPLLQYCAHALKRVFWEKDCVLLSANFALSSQMVLKNCDQFLKVIEAIGQENGEDFNKLLQSLLKIWCESIDTIVDIDKKKLSALALLSLCSLLPEFPVIANVFADIICAVVQVFYDVCDEKHVDMLLNESNDDHFDPDHLQQETLHDKRFRLLRRKSPALTISLPAFASQRLKVLQDRIPQEGFSQLMSSVNSETVDELQNALSTS